VSAAKAKDTKNKTWELTGPWAGAWKVFAGIGVVGLIGAVVGYLGDPRRFAFSWMFAYVTVLAVALGCIFFVLIQRLTSAGWSVTVRRTAEFFGMGVLVLIPLFIPIFLGMGHLFPWLGGHHGPGEAHDGATGHSSLSIITPAYAQNANPQVGQPAGQPAAGQGGQTPDQRPTPHIGGQHGTDVPAGAVADPAGKLPGAATNVPRDKPQPDTHGTPNEPHSPAVHGGGHGPGGDPHALIHGRIMGKKAQYLNRGFFLVRVAIYFVIWAILAIRLFRYSTEQDKKKNDPELTLAAQRFAPPGTFLFGLTLTFAACDWIMSLEPSWFSTIFGVTYFASGVVSSLAVIILTTLALRSSGPLDGAVTVEHYHDLGKLMFGFLVFWGYVNFSQFMLIWYAALPEETTFFHNRWDYAPWDKVSLAIILFGFVVPFFWTMSRWFKRNTGRLQIGAAILVVMHVVNMYWHVMPNYMLAKEGFAFHWMDIACLLAVAGIYGAFVFHRMTQHPLVPIGDPRLERALNFQNA
jgi:hypothetical protein